MEHANATRTDGREFFGELSSSANVGLFPARIQSICRYVELWPASNYRVDGTASRFSIPYPLILHRTLDVGQIWVLHRGVLLAETKELFTMPCRPLCVRALCVFASSKNDDRQASVGVTGAG